MEDKKIMENYLLVLKSTVEVYVHGTLESSNEKVHNTLKTCLNSTLNNQNETYNIMQNKRWYNVKNISVDMIKNTLNKLENS